MQLLLLLLLLQLLYDLHLNARLGSVAVIETVLCIEMLQKVLHVIAVRLAARPLAHVVVEEGVRVGVRVHAVHGKE